MTDRFNTLTVVLERDMRDDDAESLLQAISHFRGVLHVSGNVSDPESYMAEERARRDLGKKLFDVVYPDRKEK